MIIEQLYTNCLAEAAYYIESEGEAIIIDPIREIEPYVEKLKQRKAQLKYVLETHFHADFVSGHIDLANATDAIIVYGPTAQPNYKTHIAKDGEVFKIGKITLEVLHTPGHTPESTCYLLKDETGKSHAIFTGDTLFVGDVGRPDLLDGKMTKEELAGMMYESLNKKIKVLPDDVILYPGHGPGSACGKNIGKETWSTIGTQKKLNYALQEMSKEEFIQKVTDGLAAPPPYFFKDAMINKNGYENVDAVLKRNLKPLNVTEVKNEISADAQVLDTRDPDTFEKGFIPGAINIGLNGQFAVWAGTVLDVNKPLVLIAEPGKEHESVLRLARVGIENIKGYLNKGILSWVDAGEKTDTITSVTPQDFAKEFKAGKKTLDVRKQGEYDTAHLKGVQHICLSKLEQQINTLDKNTPYFVHCAGGYRSMIAASILKAKGYHNFINVYGGFAKIKDTGCEIEISEPAGA